MDLEWKLWYVRKSDSIGMLGCFHPQDITLIQMTI